MKKLLLPAAVVALAALGSWARTTVTLDGYDYNVDTTFHAKVGPGTTHTALRVTGRVNLNVFYVTVDRTTPGVSIRALSGGDKMAGNGKTSVMAQNHSHEGLHYFAGSNGDFYYTGGQATNGSSIVGTPVCAMTIDREVFCTANHSYQFSIDTEGVARVCRLDYQKGTATNAEGAVVPFQAINVAAPNNAVTLYTSKYWGSSNQAALADNCYEVPAKLVEGEEFLAGGKYKLEVTGPAGRTGDMTVPADGFVIFGRGTAQDFVGALKEGDVVEFDNVTLTPDGTAIQPTVVISGNPKNIGGGENLHSEAERGDATQRHPRTGIGVSADGNKVVMMVVDGRTGVSAGVTTGELGDMLLFAGCAEGVNLDGGGSSTLYTEAFGVRNHCSDGSERSVANAIYAVLEAPEDDAVAELSFLDREPTLPRMGMYTPQILAFNKYGLCLDTDFADFTLSCPAELGEVTADGHTLYVTGEGYYPLTVSYGDVTATIPVRVDDAAVAELTNPSVIIDETHPYTIALSSMVNNKPLPLNPCALEWTSGDTSIATVDADGVVSAVATGDVAIAGKLGEIELSQDIAVRNPEFREMPVFSAEDVAGWSLTKTSLTDVSVTPVGDGVEVGYTVSSTRGTKLIMLMRSDIYGCPEKLHLSYKPGECNISGLTVKLRAANSTETQSIALADVAEDNDFVIDLADYYDTTDNAIWPVSLYSITISISDEKGSVRTLSFPSITAEYASGSGVESVEADGDAEQLSVTVKGNEAHLNLPAAKITLTDTAGRVVATGSGQHIVLPEGYGVLILTADNLPAVKVVY